MRNRHTACLRLLPALVAALLLWGCASMGRPEGGPRDTAPPAYVASDPVPGQLEFMGEKITLEFDENVQLDDPMNKVIVSPPQQNTPKVSALGRRVTVVLRDTLLPNTTYTIDFSDAIKDLNEGNVLDGMALDFSTGPDIDTLRISGMVMEARNLEPAQGMVVGAWRETPPSDADSAGSAPRKIERITKTNQLGQFTLRNLPQGAWHVMALNDANRDYAWDRSEDVAFLDAPVVPTAARGTRMDTIKSEAGRDSLVTRGVTLYAPDDVLLAWFNEGYKPQALSDHGRAERNKLTFRFNAANDSLPAFTVLDRDRWPLEQLAVLQSSATMDTLTWWLSDTAAMARDTLTVEVRYWKTDTTMALAAQTDTLKMFYKQPKARKKRDDQAVADSAAAPPAPKMDFAATVQGTQELNQPLRFRAGTPVAGLDTLAFRLEVMEDSVWRPAPPPRLRRSRPLDPLDYESEPYAWREGAKYRLTIDSAAVADIYGAVNRKTETEFTARELADYSTLRLSVAPALAAPAYVEVLNRQDEPVRTVPVAEGVAVADYITPGTYYARLWVDADSNGVYTVGSLTDSIQPEEVYYYPKKFNLKKNWTVEQAWNIYDLPLDRQKPQEIKKNKPKPKAGELPEKTEGDDEEEDEFFDDPFMKAATGNHRDNVNGLDSNRRRF